MDISEDFQIVNFFIFFFAAATLALRVFFCCSELRIVSVCKIPQINFPAKIRNSAQKFAN